MLNFYDITYNDIFSLALGITNPWYVKDFGVAKNNYKETELHLYIGIMENAELNCPLCGKIAKRFGYENIPRVWRHTDWLPMMSFFHCARPKVCCQEHGIIQLNAPFERKNSRYTLRFEGLAIALMHDMPISKAAEILRCDEKTLASILHYWINDAKKTKFL